MGKDARHEGLDALGKPLDGRNAGLHGALVPVLPEASRLVGVSVAPQGLEILSEHVGNHQWCIRIEELLEAHTLGAVGVARRAQQQPLRGLDDFTCGLVMTQGVRLVDADTVNDLAAVLGDDMEEIVDDAGVRTVPLDLEGEGRVHIHHGRLDALAMLEAPTSPTVILVSRRLGVGFLESAPGG